MAPDLTTDTGGHQQDGIEVRGIVCDPWCEIENGADVFELFIHQSCNHTQFTFVSARRGFNDSKAHRQQAAW